MMRSRVVSRLWVLVLAPVMASAAAAADPPAFVDATRAAGLTYLQHSKRSQPNCIFEIVCDLDRMSGGAAVADVDGDGDLDLFVTRLDAPDILFRNRGDGTFEQATAQAGLGGFDLQSNGAAFGDVDNDGDPDLFVTVIGDDADPINNRHYLFINDGRGIFTEEAIARGAAGPLGGIHRGFSVAFGDPDRDGWLDIHTTEWMPAGRSHARLLHNRGAAAPGHFEDITEAAGVVLDQVHGFTSVFADLDGDGWQDLTVAADFGTSRLFWNNRDGTFTDATLSSGVGTDENGMGSAVGDIDGDGDLDWFVTSIYDVSGVCNRFACVWGGSGNRLYRNEGGRLFSDATDAAGVRDGAWGWGTVLFDYDNDGDLDLVMTNGVEFPRTSIEAAFNHDPMRVWRNDGTGGMTEVASLAGVTDDRSGKGLLVFDYDGDGDLDLFVVNNGSGPVLYRNEIGNSNDWVRVRAVGTRSNRDGYGARVRLRARTGGPEQVREIGTGVTYLAQSENQAHFGLGSAGGPVAQVLISWPSGRSQAFSSVAPDTTLVAVEPTCVDADGDGLCGASDCDETDPAINAAAIELPGNRVDENCDGSLAPCDPDATWANHGKFVRCVREECKRLVEAELAGRKECNLLAHQAGRSRAGKKPRRERPRGRAVDRP